LPQLRGGYVERRITMFFISKEMYMREVNNRVEEFMRESEKNREFSRLCEQLHMLERRVEKLEHPEPKDSRDVPTTCKCGE